MDAKFKVGDKLVLSNQTDKAFSDEYVVHRIAFETGKTSYLYTLRRDIAPYAHELTVWTEEQLERLVDALDRDSD